jgi:hypothetical protein
MTSDQQKGKPDWHHNHNGEELFVEPQPDHLVASEAGSVASDLGVVGEATHAAKRALFGRPISNAEEGEQRLSRKLALPIFSSDAISSSAYASEEILLVLVGAGASFLMYGPLVALGIGLLLGIIAISYRQSICGSYVATLLHCDGGGIDSGLCPSLIEARRIVLGHGVEDAP